MDRVIIVTQGFDLWEASIVRASVRMLPRIEKAIEVTARYIKDDARKTVRFHGRQLAPLVQTINYDMLLKVSSIGAEIGYDRDKAQGNLGHIIEFGQASYAKAPNAPQRNLANALAKNTDDFILGLRKAVYGAFD